MKSKSQATPHQQISENRLPEDVLRQFIADLKEPMDIVESFLSDYRTHATLRGEEDILSQPRQAIENINENIQSVIDYLHLKLKDGLIETEGTIAFEILGRFSHVLRESSAPLQGFVNIVQGVQLTKDEFEHNKEDITRYGKHLVNDFRLLESNWRVWLETRKFDWGVSDL